MIRRLLNLLDLPNNLGTLDSLIEAIDGMTQSQRKWLNQQLDELEAEILKASGPEDRYDFEAHRSKIISFLIQKIEASDGPQDLSVLRLF